MDIEELQSNWEAMSKRVAQLEIVNEKHIMEMTKQRYKSKFNHLLKYEIAGTVICFAALILILINFHKLDTPFYVISGLVIVLFIFILPFLSLYNIKKIKAVKIDSENYKNTLSQFEKSKQRLLKTQQLGIPFGAVVFFASMPVFNKLMGNDDFMEKLDTPLILFISIVFILLLIFSAWGFKKYKQIANNAGNILRELEE